MDTPSASVGHAFPTAARFTAYVAASAAGNGAGIPGRRGNGDGNGARPATGATAATGRGEAASPGSSMGRIK